MKQARFNPSPVTFCNLPIDTLQIVQTFFLLAHRSVLPAVCSAFRNVVPLVPCEKKQFDSLVKRYETSSLGRILELAIIRNDTNALQCVVALGNGLGGRKTILLGRALKHATIRNDANAMQWLLRNGADPGLPLSWNDRPIPLLHFACGRGYAAATTVLLEHGADPNLSYKNWTPCWMTARHGETATLRALAEGANRQGRPLEVNATQKYTGRTVLDFAKFEGVVLPMSYGREPDPIYVEFIAYLRELGAVTGKEVHAATQVFAREIVDHVIAIACC